MEGTSRKQQNQRQHNKTTLTSYTFLTRPIEV